MPYSTAAVRRPKEPPAAASDAPSFAKPVFMSSATAPPIEFGPYTGFEPVMTCALAIANTGSRSHCTTSPKASLARIGPWNTTTPCGSPSSGEAVKPRSASPCCSGLPSASTLATPAMRRSSAASSVLVPGASSASLPSV